MNMFKKNGGFTLVELIVVIAILAILAGVAVPAYSGYIKKAQDATVVVELDAIATAAQAANATKGAIGGITVSGNSISVTPVAAAAGEEANTLSDKFNDDFVMFYSGATKGDTNGTLTVDLSDLLDGTSYANGATWADGKWTADEASGS